MPWHSIILPIAIKRVRANNFTCLYVSNNMKSSLSNVQLHSWVWPYTMTLHRLELYKLIILIMLIKSDLKWCIHLSRSLYLYLFTNLAFYFNQIPRGFNEVFAVGVACRQGRLIIRTPDRVPFWTCISYLILCSTTWAQWFSKFVMDFKHLFLGVGIGRSFQTNNLIQ